MKLGRMENIGNLPLIFQKRKTARRNHSKIITNMILPGCGGDATQHKEKKI